jgi:flagellin-like hook-associated protein FlgL
MSDITLSTGIRQNLLSLQQTSADLTTTQEQLATGKKVNTAFDNPQSYFTSQSLTNRANDLSALLDNIGQAQQTLEQANNGLTGLTSLLEQALSTAQQAQQATTGTVNYSGPPAGTQAIAADSSQVTSTAAVSTLPNGITASTQSTATLDAAGFADLTDGDTLTFQLGSGTAVTATFTTGGGGNTGSFNTEAQLAAFLNSASGISGATAAVSGGGVTVTSNDLTNNFTVGGTALTSNDVTAADFTSTAATTGSALTLSDGTHASTFYYVAGNANAGDNTFTSLSDLTSTINSDSLAGKYITASASGSDLTLSNTSGSVTVGGAIGTALGLSGTVDNNYNATLAGLTGDLTVQTGTNSAHTITFGTGAGQVSTQAELTTALASFTDITGGLNSSSKISLTPTSTAAVTIGGTASTLSALGLSAGTTTPTATVVSANSTRSTLQSNFNSLLTQIDQLAGDSSYNGVNLLTGDNLTINFNETGTSGLTINGVNDTSSGLGLGALNNNQFQDNNSISSVVTNLNNAITTIRAQTETFGTNSSTIQTRQTFETNVINTLQTGASNLVLADQNQASANLLTEQTQQQLEISALSIANQANQSVLKLFG